MKKLTIIAAAALSLISLNAFADLALGEISGKRIICSSNYVKQSALIQLDAEVAMNHSNETISAPFYTEREEWSGNHNRTVYMYCVSVNSK